MDRNFGDPNAAMYEQMWISDGRPKVDDGPSLQLPFIIICVLVVAAVVVLVKKHLKSEKKKNLGEYQRNKTVNRPTSKETVVASDEDIESEDEE